jgi:hypothetical protein
LNLELVSHRAKFLQLVKQGLIIPPLKSFADSVLYYYLAHLALTNTQGNLFEIGVGGSTYVLTELSETHQRKFIVNDINQQRLNLYSNQDIFPTALIENHVISSLKLGTTGIGNLSYCHLDGSKDYKIALNDLQFSTQQLSVNGLICQDDYGNNKWPTVTDAVQTMIESKELIMLLVGDSSAWLTRPEYYDYWMQQFATDYEFKLLAEFLNMENSTDLHKHPNYLFMNAPVPDGQPKDLDNTVLNFYNTLLEATHDTYLQMPYREQSMPGIQFRQYWVYLLQVQSEWDKLRGSDWPNRAPATKQDIDNLPDWIKDELINILQLPDLYAKTTVVKDHCPGNKN